MFWNNNFLAPTRSHPNKRFLDEKNAAQRRRWNVEVNRFPRESFRLISLTFLSKDSPLDGPFSFRYLLSAIFRLCSGLGVLFKGATRLGYFVGVHWTALIVSHSKMVPLKLITITVDNVLWSQYLCTCISHKSLIQTNILDDTRNSF